MSHLDKFLDLAESDYARFGDERSAHSLGVIIRGAAAADERFEELMRGAEDIVAQRTGSRLSLDYANKLYLFLPASDDGYLDTLNVLRQALHSADGTNERMTSRAPMTLNDIFSILRRQPELLVGRPDIRRVGLFLRGYAEALNLCAGIADANNKLVLLSHAVGQAYHVPGWRFERILAVLERPALAINRLCECWELLSSSGAES